MFLIPFLSYNNVKLLLLLLFFIYFFLRMNNVKLCCFGEEDFVSRLENKMEGGAILLVFVNISCGSKKLNQA